MHLDSRNHIDYITNIDIESHKDGDEMLSQNLGIREVKTNLSKLMKKVQEGQEIIITDRGKPIGKIVSVASEARSLEERIRVLEDKGMLESVPKKARRQIPPPIPVPKGLAQKYLQEDRNQ